MSASIIRSLFRRPPSAVTPMVQSRLVGPSVASCTNLDDKKVKIEASITLGGLEASELEGIFPLAAQHFDILGLTLAINTHLKSHLRRKTTIDILCDAEAAFENYEDDELHAIRSSVQAYTKTANYDPDKLPKNLRNIFDRHISNIYD